MKVLSIITICIFLVGCGMQISSDKYGNNSSNSKIRTSPTIDDANANFIPVPSESENTDQTRLKTLELENEQFKAVPGNFKNIDFSNFKFKNLSDPKYREGKYIPLKNGKYEYIDYEHSGGTNYSLGDVFYLDLNNDKKKEAIVTLFAVSCGGSCDGGRPIYYFYSSQNNKPKLIDGIELGSRSSGCSLKSFLVKEKKITIEQFGRCTKDSSEDENDLYSCKFCVKDRTKSVYSIKGNSLIKESTEVVETPETNVMNYSSETSINN